MPALSQLEDEFYQEFLSIGPFGGLDTTTSPYYVAPTNFVDGSNFVPNASYGGYVTAKGRIPFLTGGFPNPSDLPGTCTGVVKLERPGQVTVWIYAVTAGAQGQLWYAPAFGVPVQLALPNGPLTPNRQTFFAQAQKWVFVTNGVDTPLKIDTSLVVTNWGIAAPATAPTLTPSNAGGAMGPGNYTYAITFANSVQESSQGTISATVTITTNTGSVALSAIPVSTDPQVTERNIYRIGGALGQWRLIYTIPDNVTTTYTDTLADTAVTGVSLTVNRDVPPPFTAITAHQERIWGFGTPSDPSQVWYSNYGEPWGFNSVEGTREAGQNSLGDIAVNLVSIGSTLVLFKTRTTYAVFGVTDADFQTMKLFDIGCASALSVCSAYGVAFWESRQGIWSYGGGSPTNISDGQYQVSNIKSVLDGIAYPNITFNCGFVYDRMYGISIPTLGKTYLFDMRSTQWFPLGFVCTQAAFDLESDIPVVAANSFNGPDPNQVTAWFQTPTDLGNPITAYLTSRVTDSDALQTTKSYHYLMIEAPTQPGAACNVYIYVNPGNDQYFDAFTFDLGNAGTKQQHSLPFTFVGAEIQMTLQTISSQTVVVHKASIYGIKQRDFLPNTTTT